MKTQVLTLLAIISCLAAQDPGHRYCGRQLSRAIEFLCYEDYIMKRSEEVKRSSYESYDYDVGYVSPWMAAKDAQVLNGRGKRQLIVSECCEKPCTIDELRGYCSN